MKWFEGKKTYIISALMAATSLMHLINGDATLQEFIMSDQVTTLMEALGLGTLRSGIARRIG